MNSNLRFDRDLLIPMAVGMVATIGLCIALWIGLRPEPAPAAAPERTVTPFKYKLLATETFTPDPSLVTGLPEDPLEEATIDPESFSTDDPGILGDPELFPTLTEDPEFFVTEEAFDVTEEPELTEEPNLEFDEEDVLSAGIYDDTDYRIGYIGDWESAIFGYETAYDGSLNISPSTGNTASFVFMGRQVVIGFLGADNDLGTAIVAIDGNPYQMDQGVGTTWSSPQLAFGEHVVIITHQTGDLLFMDQVEVR